MFAVIGRRAVAAIFALAIVAAGIAVLLPSAVSADHIPNNVSQKQKLLYASAGWSFEEPDGSFRRVAVGMTDLTRWSTGLRDRQFDACVIIRELQVGNQSDPNDDVYRSISGCQPIRNRDFRTTPTLDPGHLISNVRTQECVSTTNGEACTTGPTVNVSLNWMAVDVLVSGRGTDIFGACTVHTVDRRVRRHALTGSINGGGVEYTRNEKGTGFIIDAFEIVRVVPEGGDCS